MNLPYHKRTCPCNRRELESIFHILLRFKFFVQIRNILISHVFHNYSLPKKEVCFSPFTELTCSYHPLSRKFISIAIEIMEYKTKVMKR